MLIPFLIVCLIIILLISFSRNEKTNSIEKYEFLKKLLQKLDSMLVEDTIDGSWSANRVSYVFTMLLSNIVLWGGISFLIILNHSFPDIPSGIIMVYGISNGISSMAKVWQKREERFTEELSNSVNKNNNNDQQNN